MTVRAMPCTLLLAIGAVLPLPTADAATVSVEKRADGGSAVVVRTEPGKLDGVGVQFSSYQDSERIDVNGDVEPGPGCAEDSYHVTCGGHPRFVDAELGDGDDTLFVSTYGVSPIEVRAYGGAGDDRLEISEYLAGSVVRGQLFGEDGDDTLIASADRDVLSGGPGDDLLQGGFRRDRVDGGSGTDRVVYTDYLRDAIRVVLPSGPAPDRDRLTEVEGAEGGYETDRLIGDRRANVLVGGPGPDFLRGGRGKDVMVGGADGDRIDSRDGVQDVVACGGGRDRVTADRRDDVSAQCERVSFG